MDNVLNITWRISNGHTSEVVYSNLLRYCAHSHVCALGHSFTKINFGHGQAAGVEEGAGHELSHVLCKVRVNHTLAQPFPKNDVWGLDEAHENGLHRVVVQPHLDKWNSPTRLNAVMLAESSCCKYPPAHRLQILTRVHDLSYASI